MGGQYNNHFHGDTWYQNMIARRVRDALQERERRFLAEHRNDSDEELLSYLRGCAEEMGFSPFAEEIIGAKLIAARFGTWSNALRKAGLELPKGTVPRASQRYYVQKEIQLQKKLYRQERAEKKEAKKQRYEERLRQKEEARQENAQNPSDLETSK